MRESVKGENMKAKEKYNRTLEGERFGRLVVISAQSEKLNSNTKWNCVCDCGNKTASLAYNLLNGKSTSCGCLRKERASKFVTNKNYKHGSCKTRLYSIWHSMKCRCYYKGDRCYATYGGKGITICDEWRNDFAAFQRWANANGYSDDLTIDRIDVQKGYSPDNCRWATDKEQANNKENTVFITYDGCTKSLSKWAEKFSIPRHVLYSRIMHCGWDVKRAFTTPLQRS